MYLRLVLLRRLNVFRGCLFFMVFLLLKLLWRLLRKLLFSRGLLYERFLEGLLLFFFSEIRCLLEYSLLFLNVILFMDLRLNLRLRLVRRFFLRGFLLLVFFIV